MSSDINFGMTDDAAGGAEGIGSGVGVVRVAKRDYAIGLYWNSVNIPSNAPKEAREMASSDRVSADFYCIRNGTTPQFGLGFKAVGHKSGMASLAAHLASVKAGSWIALFAISGGFYLVAVRDDGILSECDRFFESRNEAIETFQDFQAQSDWAEEIAPDDLEIPGTKEVDIATLLDGRPPARLVEVSRSKNLVRIGVAAFVVLFGLIGGYVYIDSIEQARLQEELEAKFRQTQDALFKKEEIPIPPMPWEGKPLGIAVLDACRTEVLGFKAAIAGWKLSEVICEGETVAAALDRTGAIGQGGGPVTWIAPQVSREGFTPSVDFPPEGSGQRARVQWSTKSLPRIPVDVAKMKLAPTKRAILQVIESRMTSVTFSDADQNDFWKGFVFTFATREDPTRFGDLIAALPGVIISRIRFDVQNAEWQLEGKVYEQLDRPKQPPR